VLPVPALHDLIRSVTSAMTEWGGAAVITLRRASLIASSIVLQQAYPQKRTGNSVRYAAAKDRKVHDLGELTF
jgi:hypothetical protein